MSPDLDSAPHGGGLNLRCWLFHQRKHSRETLKTNLSEKGSSLEDHSHNKKQRGKEVHAYCVPLHRIWLRLTRPRGVLLDPCNKVFVLNLIPRRLRSCIPNLELPVAVLLFECTFPINRSVLLGFLNIPINFFFSLFGFPMFLSFDSLIRLCRAAIHPTSQVPQGAPVPGAYVS